MSLCRYTRLFRRPGFLVFCTVSLLTLLDFLLFFFFLSQRFSLPPSCTPFLSRVFGRVVVGAFARPFYSFYFVSSGHPQGNVGPRFLAFLVIPPSFPPLRQTLVFLCVFFLSLLWRPTMFTNKDLGVDTLESMPCLVFSFLFFFLFFVCVFP